MKESMSFTSAQSVINGVFAAYSALKSYSDKGRVATEIFGDDGSVEWKMEETFSSAFIRDSKFRFEFKFQFPGSTDRHRALIWSDFKTSKSWWTADSGIVEGSLSSVLSGFTGVSGGASHHVPYLLMPSLVGKGMAWDAASVRLAGTKYLGDLECYQLEAFHTPDSDTLSQVNDTINEIGEGSLPSIVGLKDVIWIASNTLLLRRIEKIPSTLKGGMKVVIDYDAFANPVISDASLRFNPGRT